MKLTYKVGDVRTPEEAKPFIIPHCVNDCEGGVMGSGVAYALFSKWQPVKDEYHRWAIDDRDGGYTSGPFRLGEIQVIKVDKGICVANMVGQRECSNFHGIPPVRYEAIRDCLWHLRDWLEVQKRKYNICSPRFASDLAGGSWTIVESIIKSIFEKTSFEWTIYTLPPRANKVIFDEK